MIENKKVEAKGSKEVEIKLEIANIAEKFGKLGKMLAKSGKGDKSGEYGH